MNKDEIISSGLLEAYLTGDLSDAEKRDVEQLLAEDEEAREEFEKIQLSFEKFLVGHGVSPSDIARNQVLENIKAGGKSKMVIMNVYWKYLTAASIVVALSAALTAYNFWQKWQNTESELIALSEQNEQLAESYNTVNNELSKIREDINVIVNPSYKRVVLSGTENAPNVSAVVYWNPDQNSVLLNSVSLNNLSQDQQYQLWALVDGTPIDAGVFDPQEGIFQNMKQIAEADAFAVTVEPKGGSKSPTLSTMQVFGKTS